jgi:pimeloyl-ACP methyl ester carboxylesterase
LKDYRVLLLDQRGTGLSSAVTHESLSEIAYARLQFDYVKNFRADNIVRDCELIRKSLASGKSWTVLGQSYGGFCAATYLSMAPEALRSVIFTGGLPPLVSQPDEVYRSTYKRVIEKNKLFYEKFPDDAQIVQKIVRHLQENQVLLPTGEILSPERFLQLGIKFGCNSSGSSMNTVHYLLERAFVKSGKTESLCYAFLSAVERMVDFNSNPLYALMHESIYCQQRASNWSAEKIMGEFPEFELTNTQLYFTGEMIYPWMFDQYEQLKPLKELAFKIAACNDWPVLYDLDALKKNTVPCVASIYYGDMYVDRNFSEQTANQIRGLKFWITNEYEHDGLRQDGEYILDRLLNILGDKK